MGKPIIWSGVNAKLINSGDLIDSKNNSLTNGAKITVTQASHGFTSSDVGRPLYLNGSTWNLAQANTSAAAEVVGFIYNVIDANTLRIAFGGQIPTVGANFLEGGGSLVAGEVYYLSATTAGTVTATEPTTVGAISKPLGVANSTTAFTCINYRGAVVGGTNARTQISLSNNTTANAQNVSAYDAGNVTGWVYIDAGTDYRFYVTINWAKNGAGTNWNLNYSTVGDTPPAGFSFTITSGGVIQYTMPNVASFVSSTFNYAINAPAIGTNFPLSVSGTNVVGGTPTIDTINEYTTNNGVQIQGRKSGSAIAAGYVGEIISGSPGSAVTPGASIGTGPNKTVVSISLTAGIWDVQGVVLFATGATLAGMSIMYCGISLTDNTSDSTSNLSVTGITTSNSLTSNLYLPCGPRRLTLTTTTTVYLVAGFNYSTLGGTTYGTASTIRATRIA